MIKCDLLSGACASSDPYLRVKSLGIFCLLLALASIHFGCSSLRPCRAEQFLYAMEQRDFARAERLWKRGVMLPTSDPYGQFMQIKDRLDRVNGVQVTNWTVGKLQKINETNRYYGLLDIQDSSGEFDRFGVGLEWRDEKWFLKDNPLLPLYVKECVGNGKR